MYNFKIVVILLLFFITNNLTAQYSVSAKVKDEVSSEPLVYSSVALLEKDSAISYAITDEKGYFEIPAKNGHYKIVIRFVGYITDTINFSISNRNNYLGGIKLKSANTELKGTEIKASIRNTDINKNEVIVTKKMRTGAASAREVMEKVNGVSYDRYKDAIKVDNKTNIVILVNGLEKNQEYVKNLNPERIAKIEVIRDPSGRYGIEGYSAILNVVLKRNYQGHEVYASSENIFDTKPQQTKYVLPIQNYSLNYNFSRKNLNLYTRASISSTKLGLNHSTQINYSNGLKLDQLPPDNNHNLFVNEKYFDFTLGADYQLNSKHTFSIEINANKSPKLPTEVNYKYNLLNDTLISSRLYNTSSLTESFGVSTSAFYIGKYSETNSLKVDLTYGLGSSTSKSTFGFVDTIAQYNSQTTDFSYVNTNIEWEQIVSDEFSIQLGYGGKWKNSENINMSFDYGNTFTQSELRNKAFGYGIWKLRKDMKFKFGLGIENNYSIIDDVERSFWIYKPHIDLFYKPSEYFNVDLKYRVETDYPSISETDPTEVYNDYLTIKKGNPNLLPTAIHKASLRMNILSGLLSIEPYFEYSNNYIAPVGGLRDDGVFIYSYGNLGKYENQGVEINLTIPIGKYIVWQNSADIYHSSMSYESISNNLTDWNGESQLMYINQKLDLVAGLLYQRNNSKYINLQGYKNQENDWWGLMIQKPFFNKKLNVMLMAFLPIDFGANYNQVTYIETPGYSQSTTVDISVLKQLFLIQLSYRFHKGKTISTIKKDIDKENMGGHKSIF